MCYSINQANIFTMNILRTLIIVLALSTWTSLNAQSPAHYVVQLGSVESLVAADLTHLSDIANVYFEPSTNGANHDAVLGTFDNLQKAEAVTQNMQRKNFPKAYVAPLPIQKGKEVYVIQLASYKNDDQIDWDRFQLNKKVFTTMEQGVFKIVTGIFPDYASALPLQNELYQHGFTTSEVIRVNSIFLHEVNNADITYQQSLHTRGLGSVSEFTAKGGASISRPAEVAPPIVGRVALSKSIAPNINEDLARNAVKNLQSILAVYGTFNAEPNGRYGAKTANAYYAAVQLNPTLKEFGLSVEKNAHISSGYFTDWSDVQLLLAISENISGQKISFGDSELKALISLYTKPKELGSADALMVKEWMIKMNTQLQMRKSTNKIEEETHKAYMLVSAKVQILLEDYYLDKGFPLEQSTNLAKATMYALLVGNHSTI